MCKFMTRFLERAGHEVRSALDARSALTLAGEFRPDVAILDISLPDMDGYALLKYLKETDGLSAARFIALSGYGENDVRINGSVNFDHFLQKPLDMSHLTALLLAASSDRAASS